MIYRLLAINIDGTLLQPRGKLQKGTKEAIDFVRSKGVYVTLLTSRNFQSARKVAKVLKLDSTLITHSGAFVASALDNKLVEKRFSEDRTFQLATILEQYNCNVRVSHEQFSLVNRKKLESTIVAKAVLSNADPIFYPIQFVESLSFILRKQPVSAPKIDAFFGDGKEKESAIKAIKKMFPDVSVIVSENERIELVPHGVSKFNGLEKLTESLGVSLEEVVVIGDSIADKECIERVGLGVAMGNAPDEVKLAADWVTRSNEERGVSYMIREHFRKQFPIPFLKEHRIIRK